MSRAGMTALAWKAVWRRRAAGTVGALMAALILAGCKGADNDAPPPPPVAVIPDDAEGYYCGMFLFEHKGPKAQALLRDSEKPVWFTTIREVFAYTRLPEEHKSIRALYVQDMARINDDGSFPFDAWIKAQEASYLIMSRYIGGMGRHDALPFSEQGAALVFQKKYGGEVVSFHEMPEDYIFGSGEPLGTTDPPKAGAPQDAASIEGARQ